MTKACSSSSSGLRVNSMLGVPLLHVSADPATAHDGILIVKNHCLSRSNSTLRIIKRDQRLVTFHPHLSISSLVSMTDLRLYTNRLLEGRERNPVQPVSAQTP